MDKYTQTFCQNSLVNTDGYVLSKQLRKKMHQWISS